MSLTDPIDCLPFPWRRGQCLPRITGINPANWINLLSLQEAVALWSKVQTISFTSDVTASNFVNTVSVSGSGVLDSTATPPVSRICSTINFQSNNVDSLDDEDAISALAQVRYRTAGASPPLISGAGVVELVTTAGDIFYSSPISILAQARVVNAPDELEIAVQLGSVDISALGTVLGSGIITIAGVDLVWVRTQFITGNVSGWSASATDPTVTVTEWTFNGTIN